MAHGETRTPTLWRSTASLPSYDRLRSSTDADVVVGAASRITAASHTAAISMIEEIASVEWSRDRFPMAGELAYGWSGQVVEPDDHLAFIGPNQVGARQVRKLVRAGGRSRAVCTLTPWNSTIRPVFRGASGVSAGCAA
jgi:hypothetical protein